MIYIQIFFSKISLSTAKVILWSIVEWYFVFINVVCIIVSPRTRSTVLYSSILEYCCFYRNIGIVYYAIHMRSNNRRSESSWKLIIFKFRHIVALTVITHSLKSAFLWLICSWSWTDSSLSFKSLLFR